MISFFVHVVQKVRPFFNFPQFLLKFSDFNGNISSVWVLPFVFDADSSRKDDN